MESLPGTTDEGEPHSQPARELESQAARELESQAARETDSQQFGGELDKQSNGNGRRSVLCVHYQYKKAKQFKRFKLLGKNEVIWFFEFDILVVVWSD